MKESKFPWYNLLADLGILYVYSECTQTVSGYVPEVLDQEVEKIKQKYEPLLKDPVNTIGGIGQSICDTAADELAKRIGGQSRSAFADDPIQREFDVISDQYIAQAKPPLKCVNKTVRTQMKATFEAAKKYERKVYYQFEGIPSQEVLDKLYEYSERYGVEVIIDTEPLGILN